MKVPSFDKSKPFYRLVLNNCVMYYGILDIVARTKMAGVERYFGPAYLDALTKGFTPKIDARATDEFDPILLAGDADSRFYASEVERAYTHKPPLSWLTTNWRKSLWTSNALQSVVAPSGVEFNLEEIVDSFDIFKDIEGVMSLAIGAGTLLISAYEVAKEMMGRPPETPEWEFLFHCRNAAAHGGKFTFRNGQPRRKSAWRNLSVTAACEGKPLIKFVDNEGLLSFGDPILLLWDLEQSTPELQVYA